MNKWQPDSWQNKEYFQPVKYARPEEVSYVTQELSKLPPLVMPLEIDALRQQLTEAAAGKRFVLQGGDCAEMFADCTQTNITNKLRILLQMSLILIHGLNKPITRIGRLAGQYAKPRSAEMETHGSVSLPSYRGDLINAPEFTVEARMPDPWRMLQGYYFSALTLNYVRTLTAGGFADLHHPEFWELEFAKHAPAAAEYQQLVNSLRSALQFINTVGSFPDTLRRIDFYISHEALHLPYEEALTQKHEDHWYNIGTHLPWVGMRTAKVDGAHIEYLRGINNPVAVKIGPQITPEQLRALIETLNPHRIPGRLTLIHRFGADKIANALPPLFAMVRQMQANVLWLCDPMHGNTTTTAEGYKTRRFEDILNELRQAFKLHRENGGHLGGVHFELTGENVTECIGGARGLTEADLKNAYQTLVDPRLNYEQALEMALLIAKEG